MLKGQVITLKFGEEHEEESEQMESIHFEITDVCIEIRD